MRKAFTMIEIIFVITIIGLLAGVALPKLIANRDNAMSSICANEVGQIIHEIANAYTQNGYNDFKNLTIRDISNVKTQVSTIDHGIFETRTTKVNITGVTYYCNGEAIVKLVGQRSGEDYNLTIEDKMPLNPDAFQTKQKLIDQNILVNNGFKNYKL